MPYKPGWQARWRVFLLLIEALADIIALSFHLAIFLLKRKKITRDITGLIEKP